MKTLIISNVLLFAIPLFFTACGGTDNSEEIANAFEREECDRIAGFWDGVSKCYNPCGNNPCGSHGISCKNTGVEAYECKCDDGYFSNGSKCVNPCDYNPCGNHGACKATGAETYECICEDNYFSDGIRCQNPCDPNPCGHGSCKSTSAENYDCICDDNYFSDGTKCLNPCEDNPCGNGTCKSIGATSYNCKCVNGEFFDGFQCESLSNCDLTEGTYNCDCKDGFEWDGSNCIVLEFPECSTANKTPCIDSETGFMWSSKSSVSISGVKSFCSDLAEGDFDNWRLPNIDELRSLINGCSNTKVGGNCNVSATNGCLSETCWDDEICASCGTTSASTISKFGDSEDFCSSSPFSPTDTDYYDYYGWLFGVEFSTGGILIFNSDYVGNDKVYVRCVR